MLHSSRTFIVRALRAVAVWPLSRWGIAAGGAVLTALVVGLPTAVIPNPLFTRTVPTPFWGYPSLALTAVLAGLLLATYVRTGARARDRRPSRLGTVGGLLGFFAVGCPVCNKLVLLALGTSGALSIWQPLQPLLAVVSLALLTVATVRRLAGEIACPAA
ncbi:hypothetical protein ACIQU6_20695 [Streptomyces sp. NPDC090442]|uniref:hypothetical protein n=1 Tax=Streptomyces sp. NPDC090442 TaxID=3365962 RepID=UPI00381DED80